MIQFSGIEVSFDLLEQYLAQHPEAYSWGDENSSLRENALFLAYHGLRDFRMAMASFMEKIREGRMAFDPERFIITAGATAANELMTFILADPGDALLVLTPYYPGFDRDIRWRTGVHIIPVHCDSSNDFQISPEALEEAYAEAESVKIRVKGLLLTPRTRWARQSPGRFLKMHSTSPSTRTSTSSPTKYAPVLSSSRPNLSG